MTQVNVLFFIKKSVGAEFSTRTECVSENRRITRSSTVNRVKKWGYFDLEAP